jgi:hypothetical protein
MPTFISRNCEHCSTEFILKKKGQRFCNAQCVLALRRLQSSRPKQPRCVNCNTNLSNKPFNKFCSKSCAATYNNKTRDQKIRVKQRATLMTTLASQGLVRTDEKEIYKAACSFKFKPYQYHNIAGYNLLLENGVFNPQTNKDGVVRDHIVSKEFGWRNQISPEIISHPANCQFISNTDNSKKGADCDLSLEELLLRIKNWDKEIQCDQVSKSRSPVKVKALLPARQQGVYKWKLQHKTTLEIVEVTQIVKWLKERGENNAVVYGKNPQWTILEKINLKTQKRLL